MQHKLPHSKTTGLTGGGVSTRSGGRTTPVQNSIKACIDICFKTYFIHGYFQVRSWYEQCIASREKVIVAFRAKFRPLNSFFGFETTSRNPSCCVARVDFYTSYTLAVVSNGLVRRRRTDKRVLSIIHADAGFRPQLVETLSHGRHVMLSSVHQHLF